MTAWSKLGAISAHIGSCMRSIISLRRAKRGKNVRIRSSRFHLGEGASITLGRGVVISGYNIVVMHGNLSLGDNVILEGRSAFRKPTIRINQGTLAISHHSIIKCDISVRFGGRLEIGEYTAINENSEIRCEDAISIGDFCMISYECAIYDTNTHNIYTPTTRREMTMRDYPLIGMEYERPPSGKVSIGNDCWVGKRAAILKDTSIGEGGIIGFGAVVTNRSFPPGSIIVGNPGKEKNRQGGRS